MRCGERARRFQLLLSTTILARAAVAGPWVVTLRRHDLEMAVENGRNDGADRLAGFLLLRPDGVPQFTGQADANRYVVLKRHLSAESKHVNALMHRPGGCAHDLSHLSRGMGGP